MVRNGGERLGQVRSGKEITYFANKMTFWLFYKIDKINEIKVNRI